MVAFVDSTALAYTTEVVVAVEICRNEEQKGVALYSLSTSTTIITSLQIEAGRDRSLRSRSLIGDDRTAGMAKREAVRRVRKCILERSLGPSGQGDSNRHSTEEKERERFAVGLYEARNRPLNRIIVSWSL